MITLTQKKHKDTDKYYQKRLRDKQAYVNHFIKRLMVSIYVPHKIILDKLISVFGVVHLGANQNWWSYQEYKKKYSDYSKNNFLIVIYFHIKNILKNKILSTYIVHGVSYG